MNLASVGKRAALLVGAMGLTGLLVGGASFAYFYQYGPYQENTFAAGTVTIGDTSLATCQIANMQPGDSTAALQDNVNYFGGDSPCTYALTYTGSIPADLWLLNEIDAPAIGNSDSGLTDLTVAITDSNGTTYTSGMNAFNEDWMAYDVSNGWSDTVTVNYGLPFFNPNGNADQGATADVQLEAVAIQANPTNTIIGQTNPPTLGTPVDPPAA
jgi:predicted ribosomally synthesized peptide with SipW-like signal peptide